jgi:TonB family protein
MPFRLGFLLACLFICALSIEARAARTTVAVLDLGPSESAARIADELARALGERRPDFSFASRAQARAAAKGVGYAGSLNLTLEEARDLGAAVGCDLFVAGAADTLRRQSSARDAYFESFASLFFVSSRTGRLLLWERPAAEAATPEAAERELLAKLRARADDYAAALSKALEEERAARLLSFERDTPVIVEAPDEGAPATPGYREPLPYRRLRPAYPDAAARSEVEATVDALVELDAGGEVRGVEIVRWAGYGIDESVTQTIRLMHFRPALREGRPSPARVLLRYNFRRPAN